MNYVFLAILIILLSFSKSFSHSGRTNSEGCHNQTSNNTYHCHNKKSKSKNEHSFKNLKITDGDTISINGTKVRFSGIDAPESYYRGKEQKCLIGDSVIDCGKLSKNFLIKLVGKKTVECKLEKKPDQYNRKLGECFVENKSLSRLMVKNGYAFDYPKYSKKKFAKEQEYAKNNKLGLWNMKFEFPWIFREKVRNN